MRGQTRPQIRLDDPGKYQSIVDAEWEIIYRKLRNCADSGAKIVLSRLAIGDLGTQFFADRDIFCAGRVRCRPRAPSTHPRPPVAALIGLAAEEGRCGAPCAACAAPSTAAAEAHGSTLLWSVHLHLRSHFENVMGQMATSLRFWNQQHGLHPALISLWTRHLL